MKIISKHRLLVAAVLVLCDPWTFVAAQNPGVGKDQTNETETEAQGPMPGGPGDNGDIFCSVGQDADCETCLNAGCGFAQTNECLGDCQFIADASCWSVRDTDKATAPEVCNEATTFLADSEICGNAEITDCETCTTTLKSDGQSPCEWYSQPPGRGYCGTGGGDMMGNFPSTECNQDDTDTDGTDAGEVLPEDEDEMPTMTCELQGDESADCATCLGADDCGYIPGTGCLNCDMIADVACYDTSMEGTIEDICMVAATTQADNDICGADSITDCESCTATVKSDGESTCAWYTLPDGSSSYCGIGAGSDMMGSSFAFECDAAPTESGVDTHPCNQFPDCEPCLNSRMECAWIGGGCEPSCDVIADARCYHPASFTNMTGPEICAIAEEDAASGMATDGGMMPESDNETNTSTEVSRSEPATETAAVSAAAGPGRMGTVCAIAVSLCLAVVFPVTMPF